jgi:hypothetical protein
MTLADDQAHLLRPLLRHGVEFVVVGGVAAQLRGWSGPVSPLRKRLRGLDPPSGRRGGVPMGGSNITVKMRSPPGAGRPPA